MPIFPETMCGHGLPLSQCYVCTPVKKSAGHYHRQKPGKRARQAAFDLFAPLKVPPGAMLDDTETPPTEGD